MWPIKLWQWIVQRFISIFSPAFLTLRVEEHLPTQLKRKTLYVVHEDGFDEYAAMLCPCGCTNILFMNLLSDERPCWSINYHENGTATLRPSIWRKRECTSHFWFRKGRVVWCKQGIPPGQLE